MQYPPHGEAVEKAARDVETDCMKHFLVVHESLLERNAGVRSASKPAPSDCKILYQCGLHPWYFTQRHWHVLGRVRAQRVEEDGMPHCRIVVVSVVLHPLKGARPPRYELWKRDFPRASGNSSRTYGRKHQYTVDRRRLGVPTELAGTLWRGIGARR